MTKRAVRTGCMAIALSLSTGLLSWEVTASAATAPRNNVADRIARNAAIAPTFDPAQPTRLEEFTQNVNLRSVHFDFDRAAVRPVDARIVDSDARWLKANPPYEIVIEGYSDDRGAKAYNVALAKRRAKAVRDQLVARGIRPDRITLVAYGEARPECHAKAKSEACWSKNRRADILVRRPAPQTP